VNLTPAFALLLDIIGTPVKHPDDYKAPHAYRGTPARPRKGRLPTVWLRNPKTGEPVAKLRRLFKGHRP